MWKAPGNAGCIYPINKQTYLWNSLSQDVMRATGKKSLKVNWIIWWISMAISHDSWIEPRCPEVIWLWITIYLLNPNHAFPEAFIFPLKEADNGGLKQQTIQNTDLPITIIWRQRKGNKAIFNGWMKSVEDATFMHLLNACNNKTREASLGSELHNSVPIVGEATMEECFCLHDLHV